MSAHTVIRRELWTLTPDREPDAEPLTFAMECAVCDQRSVIGEDVTEAQDWALRHAGRNPSHHSYRELITRPWRTWMGAG
ncbi:hypothetical protein ABZW18_15565 [Streptomyces sp. NPDC004647]|uniref:DUF7848 domain-containing protein n=1 Tax=Streptomyces sp. NPDC004647 TaxID=3154671 RepID=UPI0033AACBBE